MHVEPNAEAAELYLRNVSSRISACKTFALPSWYLVALTRQAGDPTTLRSDSLFRRTVLSNNNRTNPPNVQYPQCLQHKWSEPFHSSPCCRHADHLQSPGYRGRFRRQIPGPCWVPPALLSNISSREDSNSYRIDNNAIRQRYQRNANCKAHCIVILSD